MLIPIGDSLKTRQLPMVGLALIAANVLVSIHQFRLHFEDRPPSTMLQHYDYESIGKNLTGDEGHVYPAPEAAPPSSSKMEAFVREWGFIPTEFAEGRYDSLLTHQFLHGDIWHLVGNLMTLWVFLPALEAGMGRIRFLLLYLASGIAGGLLHWYTHQDAGIPLIGASGAISGMIAAYFVAFGAVSRIRFVWNGGIFTGFRWVPFSLPAGVYVFFWLVLPNIAWAEVETTFGFSDGVAWFAHLGGMAMGAGLMTVMRGSVMGQLSHNRDGEIVVGESEESIAAATSAPTSENAAKVNTAAAPARAAECHYCHTSLSEGTLMSEGLVRCGNPACRNLVFTGYIPPAKKPNRRLAQTAH